VLVRGSPSGTVALSLDCPWSVPEVPLRAASSRSLYRELIVILFTCLERAATTRSSTASAGSCADGESRLACRCARWRVDRPRDRSRHRPPLPRTEPRRHPNSRDRRRHGRERQHRRTNQRHVRGPVRDFDAAEGCPTYGLSSWCGAGNEMIGTKYLQASRFWLPESDPLDLATRSHFRTFVPRVCRERRALKIRCPDAQGAAWSSPLQWTP
jgi:hypothetical protein